jgi:hypothetical protein
VQSADWIVDWSVVIEVIIVDFEPAGPGQSELHIRQFTGA